MESFPTFFQIKGILETPLLRSHEGRGLKTVFPFYFHFYGSRLGLQDLFKCLKPMVHGCPDHLVHEGELYSHHQEGYQFP